jgi:hypothetical protein
MATIDLRDPALREKYGLRQQNAETVSRPSKWYKEPRQDHRDRAETQNLILQALMSASRPLSRREIRQFLGRGDSPYFRHVLAELVALGCIVEIEVPFSHLMPMFVYEVVG